MLPARKKAGSKNAAAGSRKHFSSGEPHKNRKSKKIFQKAKSKNQIQKQERIHEKS